MVVSFLGLSSQNQYRCLRTRRCEGFPRHQFPTLYRSLLTPLSLLSVRSVYPSLITSPNRCLRYSGLSVIYFVLHRLNKEAKPRCE